MPKPPPSVFFRSPAAWRAWLERHHAKAAVLQVGYYKRATGRPSLTWRESVDVALCFGWIDGVRHSLDAERYTIRFTPRRPDSIWSAVNIARVEALTREGLMVPAGLKAFEQRRPEKTGRNSFDERAAANLAPAEQRAFKANKAAWMDWRRRPPSYRKAATGWVVSAKKPETRARRLANVIADCAAGRAIKPLTPPKPKWK